MSIGETLKTWREAQDLTQSELANRLAISQPFIAQLETGEKAPGLKLAARIERLTGGELKAAMWAPSADGESNANATEAQGEVVP